MREVFTGGKSPELPTPPWPEDPWSYAVAAKGTLIFTCGQLGKDRKTGRPVPGGLEAQTKQAIENLQKAVNLSGGASEPLGVLGYTYGVFGKRKEALKILHQLTFLSKRRNVPPYDIALVYVGLGEKDRAFDWLQKGVADHLMDLGHLRMSREMESIRSDPRYLELLRRMGLPP